MPSPLRIFRSPFLIYAIRQGDSGPIKFGVAGNPRARLSELQTGNPERLSLLVQVDLPDHCERQIHGWLREERLVGEWFHGDKTADVLRDLRARAMCRNPYAPDDDEYVFWDWVYGCGGSCAQGAAPCPT